MKKKSVLLLILMLIFSLTVLTACKKDADSSSDAPEEDVVVAETEDEAEVREDLIEGEPLEENGVAYDEEQEGAQIQNAPSTIAMYIGSWTATSDMAQFLYGNVDLTIKEDGTWKGNITGDDIGGKWVQQGNQLHMQSKVFDFDLAFSTSGKLIMTEKNPDGDIHTVLVRK
jgi:hypothetical protein